MARFITYPENCLKIGNYNFKNSPINIDLVLYIEKTRVKYYPYNDGIFHFVGGTKISWLFQTEE